MNDSVPRWLRTAAAVGWRLLVLGTVIVFTTRILSEIRVLVIPAILSLFLASLATPVAVRLRERGLPRLAATLVVFVGAILILGGTIWFISNQVASSVDEMSTSIDDATEQVTDWLAEAPFGLTEARVAELIEQARDTITSNSESLIGGVAGGAATLLEVVTGLLLMLIFAFFVIKDGDRFWEWLLSFVPSDRREVTRTIGERSWSALRSYLGGTALVGLVDAVLIGIGLLILGVPLAVPLMILVFFGAFFPLIGATISGVVAALVALATVGVVEALIVVGIVLVVQRVEGDLLMPILIGKAVDMHPLLIIVALTMGFIVSGLVGGFLAIPMLAVVIVAIKAFRDDPDIDLPDPIQEAIDDVAEDTLDGPG